MSQSPAEPGRSDILAPQERMAEVKRGIAGLARFTENIQLDGFSPAVGTATHLANLKAELFRLRNEGGGEKTCCIIAGGSPNDPCPRCGRYFEEPLPHDCPAASPSDLPAREAIEPTDARVNEIARVLMAEFKRVEPKHVISNHPTSWWATFADMARAVIASPALQPLSQGKGEAVGWEAEAEFWCRLFGRAVDALDVIAGNEDEDWNPEEFASSTAEALRGEYAKRPIPRTAPPSQSEGVREALETACKRIQLVRNELTDDEQSLMLKAAIRDIDKAIALTATPSRGGTRRVNGKYIYEPPTYAQQLNTAKHRAETAEQSLTSERQRREELEAIARPLAQGWHSYGNAEEGKLELLRGTLGIWHFSDADAYFRKYEPGK